jgi:hypothetical protein
VYELSAGTATFFIQTKSRENTTWVDASTSLSASGSQTITLGDDVRIRVSAATSATLNMWVEDCDNAVAVTPAVPDTLAFAIQPVNNASGATKTMFAVSLVKSSVIVPKEGVPITISKNSGATCVLSGLLTVPTGANGIAYFSLVVATATPVEAVTLAAAATGYTGVNSNSFNVT